METKRADIFVPTSNRVDSLRQCLESLSNQSRKDFRILLVGLKKDEHIDGLISEFPDLDILYFIQRTKGLIAAANEAVDAANNEFFIRIDDDVIITEDWFKSVIKTFDSDKKIGGVTGPTVMSEEGIASRDLTAFLNNFKNSLNPLKKFLYWIYSDYLYEGKMFEVSNFVKSGVFTLGSNYPSAWEIKSPIEVGNLEACNWAARTKILKKIDGFDPIYIKGLGDYHESDAALKIKKEGYKLVFSPKARLRHNVEVGSVPKARPVPYFRIQNLLIFYFRFFKIKSLDQLLRFSVNVVLQNSYYLFRFFTTGSLDQLGSIPGTLVGLYRVIIKREHEI